MTDVKLVEALEFHLEEAMSKARQIQERGIKLAGVAQASVLAVELGERGLALLRQSLGCFSPPAMRESETPRKVGARRSDRERHLLRLREF